MFRALGIVASLSLALAACAGPRELGGSPTITVVNSTELPAPDGSGADSFSPIYQVGGRDRLLIDVLGIEELQKREVETDLDGGIALPIVGRIQAAGMTLTELESALTQRLRASFVRDPKVSVNPIELRSLRITVDGSVREPGIYPALQKTTLLQAVAQAKGVSEFAQLSDVVVFRNVEGRTMVALFNLEAIRRGAYADPAIFPDDTIIVGESSSRRLFQNLIQGGALITAPVVALLNR